MTDERIRSAASKVFGIAREAVNSATSVDTVEQWDSLGHIRFILEIESSFGIKFPSGDIPELLSVALIEARLRARGMLND